MNEVEKMYENANIKAKEYCDRDSDACMACCPEWENRQDCWKYKSVIPPFTAEKQLELIKTIETKCDLIDCIQIVYRPMEDLWKISIIPVLEMAFEEMYLYFGCDKDFSTALAMAINNLWQDLTEEEKQQVKGILE